MFVHELMYPCCLPALRNNICYLSHVYIGVMQILKNAAGPNRVPEFQSTHPDPDNRIEKIEESIIKYQGEGN